MMTGILLLLIAVSHRPANWYARHLRKGTGCWTRSLKYGPCR